MVEPARAAAECRAKRIVIVTASRSGKTETLLDLAGHRLDQKPAPVLYVGPTSQFVKEQFEPRVMALLDEAPTLSAKVLRGKRMSKTRKVVGGVPFRLAHAGSSSALKSDSATLALVDEYDEMLANVKGQGDPLGLVEHRGDEIADFCAVVTSTCKTGMVAPVHDQLTGLDLWARAPDEDVAESPIWKLWQAGSRHHWCWPCPHCHDYFVPRFDRLRYPEGASPIEVARSSYLECPRCGGVIEESQKIGMNERGRYAAPGQSIGRDGVVHGEPPETFALSFWVSGLCSPFVTFGERAKAYVEAIGMGDNAMVQTAVNAGFGELYAPGGHNVREWQQVKRHCETHVMGQIPDGVVKLSCAVDVGKTYLCYSVRGWGARATSWQILSDELHGFTNEPEIWEDLANVLFDSYGGLAISLMLIDTGWRPNKADEGPTNVAYEFCRRFSSRARPTKGYATLTAPIVRGKAKVTVPGRKLQVPLELVRLDTDFWKSRLVERLTWPDTAPGGFWLASDASEDYCRQLCSEVRMIAPSGKPEWVTVSRKNHFWDCEAMNEAAGHMLAAQKIPQTRAAGFEAAEEHAPPAVPSPEDRPPAPPPPPRSMGDTKKRMFQFAQRLNR